MILEMFCVRDAAANAFGRPYFLQSSGIALRSFTDEVNRKADDNMMHTHPADFSLYHLGSYDDSNGKFLVMDQPVLVVHAEQVVVKSA